MPHEVAAMRRELDREATGDETAVAREERAAEIIARNRLEKVEVEPSHL